MKNIAESGHIMGIYAQIDLMYYAINEIAIELNKPKPNIDILIDNATGYDKAQTKSMKKDLIQLLRNVIELKKEIEADYSVDETALNALLNLKNK